MELYSNTNHISIEVDLQKQIFRLSSIVFESKTPFSRAIAKYFETIAQDKAKLFLKNEKSVVISEEIPFAWGYQPTLRHHFYRFMKNAKKCRHLFKSIAHWEQRRDVDEIFGA